MALLVADVPAPEQFHAAPQSRQVYTAEGGIDRMTREDQNEGLAMLNKLIKSILPGSDDLWDFESALSTFESISGYQLISLETVHKRERWKMFRAFGEIYDIKSTEHVFHGTSKESAECIKKSGFRGAAAERSVFGKGVYSTTKLSIAAQYAKPNLEGMQAIIMAQILLGPITQGRKDMMDFGTYAQTDKEILTTTNDMGNIFCSKFEDALYADAVVTIRHRGEPRTPMHETTFPRLHPDIWKMINSPPNPTVVPPVRSQPLQEFKDEHNSLKKGDTVRLNKKKTVAKYKNIEGEIIGKIVCISRNTGGPWFLHLEPLCNDIKQKVGVANMLSKDPLFSGQLNDHVRALVGHFEKISNGATRFNPF